MKEGIHPKYHEIEARCACGATWKTRSTKPELHLEICNNCHPFFTGRQKLVDTEGRVERFTKRFGVQTSESRKAAAKTAKTAEEDRRRQVGRAFRPGARARGTHGDSRRSARKELGVCFFGDLSLEPGQPVPRRFGPRRRPRPTSSSSEQRQLLARS